jgi:hypothetical protein
MLELSPEILFAVALVASVAVWGIKQYAKTGRQIPDAVLTSGVYVVSAVLALFFSPVSLPPFPAFVDLFTFIPALIAWVGALLVPLSAFAGFAGLIYQALLKRILDGMAARLRG